LSDRTIASDKRDSFRSRQGPIETPTRRLRLCRRSLLALSHGSIEPSLHLLDWSLCSAPKLGWSFSGMYQCRRVLVRKRLRRAARTSLQGSPSLLIPQLRCKHSKVSKQTPTIRSNAPRV